MSKFIHDSDRVSRAHPVSESTKQTYIAHKRRKMYLLRGDRGSASVFLIIVLVPIFMFQAIFVDAIRVGLAGRDAEMALKAGLRSVMSGYDQQLANYGLYGLPWDGETSMTLLQEVMKQQLEVEGSEFRYTDTRLEDGQNGLQAVYTLANPTVFQRHVVQEMKIKAPVEFAAELADKFKKTGASSSYSDGAEYYKKAEQLEELYWKREEAMDKAWASAQDLIALAEAGGRIAKADVTHLQELADKIGLNKLDETRQKIAELQASIQQLQERARDIQQSIMSFQFSLAAAAAAGANIQGAGIQLAAMSNSLQSVTNEIGSLSVTKENLEQILSYMLEYIALYGSSKLTVQAKAAIVQEAQRKTDAAIVEAAQAEEAFQQVWQTFKSSRSDGQQSLPAGHPYAAAYTSGFFDAYRTGAAKIAATFNGLAARWTDVEWWHSARWDGISGDLDLLMEQVSRYETERKQEEEKREQRNTGLKQEENKQRRTIKSALGELKQALGMCASGDELYKEAYDRLNGTGGLASKYKTYGGASSQEYDSSVPGDPDNAIGKGMGILESLGGLLGGFRDELLQNEYLLDKFSYRTRSDAGSTTEPSTLPSGHLLDKQEAEYALYGFNSCSANLGAAYGEIYMYLFAIRTVEAFLEPGTQALELGTPFLAVLTAAAKGAVKALEDVKRLSEGGSVALFQRFSAFQVTYKDFLRLILLLHPNHDSVLSRIQALVELNTGVDLTQTTTYLKGTGTASVRLWFLPGMMGWLNRTTGAGWETESGRCLIRRTAVYSYD